MEYFTLPGTRKIKEEGIKNRFSKNALKFFSRVTEDMNVERVEAFPLGDENELWYFWGFRRPSFKNSLLARVEEDKYLFLNKAIEEREERGQNIDRASLVEDLRKDYRAEEIIFEKVVFEDPYHRENETEFDGLVGDGKSYWENHLIELSLAVVGGGQMVNRLEATLKSYGILGENID